MIYEWSNVDSETWDDLPALHDTLIADGVLAPVTDERLTRAEWEATIRDKAKIVLTDAMMYGNDTAAHNSGADRDYYEQEADWYLDELLAAVKGET